MAVGANITYLAYFRQVDPTRLLEITFILVCLLADKWINKLLVRRAATRQIRTI